jgi:Uma2 family endonuclease
LQSRIAYWFQTLLPKGRTITECPISTADGVKAADVAWASPERMAEPGDNSCFSRAPEICVEVLSPDNTEAEIREEMKLFFDAGAQEAWICAMSGEMRSFGPGLFKISTSRLCPTFPPQIELR